MVYDLASPKSAHLSGRGGVSVRSAGDDLARRESALVDLVHLLAREAAREAFANPAVRPASSDVEATTDKHEDKQ